MPYIISGVIAVPVRKAKEHLGHHLTALDVPVNRIYCHDCEATVEQEYRDERLPCGCDSQEQHDRDVALMEKLRREYRVPKSACVGCHIGDDAPSLHSCVIHQF